MVQRTFPCVFLSRTYSSYAICTKKKKRISKKLLEILSLERPTFASSNYPTNVRSKKRKKKNHPSRFPTPRKIATRNLSERIVPRYACCREFFPSLSSLLFPLASLCTCARTLHARSKTPSNIAKRKMLRRARWFPIMRFTVFTFRLITLPIPRSTPRELWPYFHKTRSHVLFGERGRIYLRRDISETDFRRGGRPPGDDQSANVKVKRTINFFSIPFSCFEKHEMFWSLTL